MRCRNISTDDHSLYINPNGICNKCQTIKDRNYERKLRGLPFYQWKIFHEGKIMIKTREEKE